MSHRRVGGAKTSSTINNDEDAPQQGAKRKIIHTNSTATTVTSLNLETADDSGDDSDVEKGAVSTMEERYESEKHDLKVKHWKKSDFAVGLVEITWADERQKMRANNSSTHFSWDDADDEGTNCLSCSAIVCPYFSAGRVGNMIVMRESTIYVETEVEDEETGELKIERVARPRLDCLLGPYWPMLLFVTVRFLLLDSQMFCIRRLHWKQA
jgi:hypothetical protein